MVVARAAIEHGLKYQLELGGNNPALVLGDADLDLVERELVSGVLGSTGQKCTATRRVFVAEERFDEVLERLTRSFAAKRLGAGVDEGTEVGPLVNRAAQESFERTVAETAECGVDVRRFGVLPEAGCFVQPTILVDPDPSAGYVQRETFGPLVSVMRVRDAEEGVRRCNESIYGLSASVFTSDIGSAIRFAKAIEAGMVHVNSQTTGAEPHMPFGGMKASSNFSRELGETSLDWFSQTRAIYVEG
jgi:aldehyde dehydrogenase (NAD+)